MIPCVVTHKCSMPIRQPERSAHRSPAALCDSAMHGGSAMPAPVRPHSPNVGKQPNDTLGCYTQMQYALQTASAQRDTLAGSALRQRNARRQRNAGAGPATLTECRKTAQRYPGVLHTNAVCPPDSLSAARPTRRQCTAAAPCRRRSGHTHRMSGNSPMIPWGVTHKCSMPTRQLQRSAPRSPAAHCGSAMEVPVRPHSPNVGNQPNDTLGYYKQLQCNHQTASAQRAPLAGSALRQRNAGAGRATLTECRETAQ